VRSLFFLPFVPGANSRRSTYNGAIRFSLNRKNSRAAGTRAKAALKQS
jgi:hypothetical protein